MFWILCGGKLHQFALLFDVGVISPYNFSSDVNSNTGRVCFYLSDAYFPVGLPISDLVYSGHKLINNNYCK